MKKVKKTVEKVNAKGYIGKHVKLLDFFLRGNCLNNNNFLETTTVEESVIDEEATKKARERLKVTVFLFGIPNWLINFRPKKKTRKVLPLLPPQFC